MAEQLTMEKANELLFKLNELQQNFFYNHKKSTTQIDSVPIDSILHEICQKLVEVLKCQSVNIWTFNHDKTRLNSVSFYSVNYKRPKKSQLKIETMPNYFKMISDQRIIAITDIRSATLPQI